MQFLIKSMITEKYIMQIITTLYVQNCRVQAFVPSYLAEKFEKQVIVGKMFTFYNFTVKDYKADEKYRCTRMDIQIIFTKNTEVTDLDENESLIENNAFDFFDLAELKELAHQNTYLTGTYYLYYIFSSSNLYKN